MMLHVSLVETSALCSIHKEVSFKFLQCQAWLCWAFMITAVVGFDENCFRCAGELEHSCKDHSSKQTSEKIHTALLQTGPSRT